MSTKVARIYKHNRINRANFGNFEFTDYKVFLMLIKEAMCGKSINTNLDINNIDLVYTITAKDYSDIFGTPLQHCYEILDKSRVKLVETYINVEEISKTKRRGGRMSINVCSSAEYKDGKLFARFTKEFLPFLILFGSSFMSYNIKQVGDFNSIYTTRLFELLQEFKDTGRMIKSIEQLKDCLAVAVDKKYKHLKADIIDPAVKDINKNTDLNLQYQEIKQGRKTSALDCTFNQQQLKEQVF